jgi:hypothetical protein
MLGYLHMHHTDRPSQQHTAGKQAGKNAGKNAGREERRTAAAVAHEYGMKE